MTTEKLAIGWERAEDGVLLWYGGAGSRYADPGEAMRFVGQRGEHFRCTERRIGGWRVTCCGAVAKHDPDAQGNPTKCGIHSAAAKAKREAKKAESVERMWAVMQANERVSKAEAAVFKALKDVADGHNNPRRLARETLTELAAARAARKDLSQ